MQTKRGNDGLTDRQRQFVRIVRSNPFDGATSWADIAERAGYKGSRQKLGERARKLMRDPRVLVALHAAGDRRAQLRAALATPSLSEGRKRRAEGALLWAELAVLEGAQRRRGAPKATKGR